MRAYNVEKYRTLTCYFCEVKFNMHEVWINYELARWRMWHTEERLLWLFTNTHTHIEQLIDIDTPAQARHIVRNANQRKCHFSCAQSWEFPKINHKSIRSGSSCTRSHKHCTNTSVYLQDPPDCESTTSPQQTEILIISLRSSAPGLRTAFIIGTIGSDRLYCITQHIVLMGCPYLSFKTACG